MEYVLSNLTLSRKFKELGIFKFDEACDWVKALPYKRNSTKEDAQIVLREKCGTCSSKHELIKRLADENKISECKLILCIFKMSGQNTLKIKPLLTRYGLSYIPEAHVYITIQDEIHDLTFPENSDLQYQKDIIYKEYIAADQIKSYKEELHKRFLENWVKEFEISYSFEEIWSIREACISAMSQ